MTHTEILTKQFEDLRQSILSEAFAVSALVRNSSPKDDLYKLGVAFDKFIEATYKLNEVMQYIELGREFVDSYSRYHMERDDDTTDG